MSRLQTHIISFARPFQEAFLKNRPLICTSVRDIVMRFLRPSKSASAINGNYDYAVRCNLVLRTRQGDTATRYTLNFHFSSHAVFAHDVGWCYFRVSNHSLHLFCWNICHGSWLGFWSLHCANSSYFLIPCQNLLNWNFVPAKSTKETIDVANHTTLAFILFTPKSNHRTLLGSAFVEILWLSGQFRV